MQRLAAAIDIGGTNTVYGLVDSDGKILVQESVSTTDYPDPKKLAEYVSEEISRQIDKLGKKKYSLAGVGIGAPNGNYFNGTIEFAPNLNWKGVIPLAKYFSDNLNCKAVLTNDANAAALGEMIFGGAKKMKDFLFITLGTGLGSGIVVNGELVYGHDGFAGELGHVIVRLDGRPCGCGRNGCLETYCSAKAIVKTYLGITKNREARKQEIDAKYVFDQAGRGEAEAIKSFEMTGDWLGLALANSVAYTSPEAIFLFGGLANAGNLIFTPTRESFERNLLNIYKNKIKILPSELNQTDAALLGAASLIWQEIKSNEK